MCSSKAKPLTTNYTNSTLSAEPKINGRRVLQPTCNRVSSLERRNSLKKTSPKPPQALSIPNEASKAKSSVASPPLSPKLPSPRQPAVKRGKDPNELNSSADKGLTPQGGLARSLSSVKKSRNSGGKANEAALKRSLSLVVNEAPGSIAAARREQVAIMREQRKLRIAHYGRTNPAKYLEKEAAVVKELDSPPAANANNSRQQKRCSYITPNSDHIYVAYHDDEWGVPVHDDKLLFELLVLTGAQVGSDWTSVLKKRESFREAFSGFDAESVAQYNEKKITSISADHGIDLKLIRGAVDNANRILAIKKGFGTLDKYLWGFVNHKPVSTQYKTCQRIPVKTSKSESISKDMVRRGFRFVGPTMIHSFMQASGLTNDHLITCPRHLQCIALASQGPTVAPAL